MPKLKNPKYFPISYLNLNQIIINYPITQKYKYPQLGIGYSSSIPIIGILGYKTSKRSNFKKGSTYIFSSYIKFLEINNLKWIGVSIENSEKDFVDILKKLNGFFLPGGAGHILEDGLRETNFYKKVNLIISHSKKLKKENINFPIFGGCLGAEVLVTVICDKKLLVKDFVNINQSLFLNLVEKNIFKKNCFLRLGFTNEEIYELGFYDFFYFNHLHALLKNDIDNCENFHKEFYALAYAKKKDDDDKREFLAAFQHKSLPIMGWQFHPEKVLFDTNDLQRIYKTEKSLLFSTKFSKIIKFFTFGQRAKITDEELLREKAKASFTFNYGYPVKQEAIILPPPKYVLK